MNRLLKNSTRALPLLALFVCMAAGWFNASAATTVQKVEGVVVNEEGAPVAGATISEAGNHAAKSVVSDEKGFFTITVNAGATLRVSHVSYNTRDVKVEGKGQLLIVLTAKEGSLDDVVVIGYGTQRRKDLTGSVGVAKVNEMQKAPVVSFDNALAGRIAGVQVSNDDAQPGRGMDIVIRGGNSLTQDNSPLYVIDGFPVEGFTGSSLNPKDIKTINILKDASATAIYGSRGANGVVLIETIDGKIGKTTVSYDGYMGVNRISNKMELMNAYDFVKYQKEINPVYADLQFLYDGKTIDDYKNAQTIDWQGLLFRDAPSHNHSLQISGGSNATRFSASGSYVSDDGIVINSGYQRYQGRLYLNHALSTKVRFNVSMDYSKDKISGDLASQSTAGTQQYASYLLYRTWGYRPVLGRDAIDITNEFIDPDANDTRVNPVIDAKNSKRDKNGEYYRVSGNVLVKLHKDLELVVKGGVYNRTIRETAFYNSKTSRGSLEMAGNTKGINGLVNFRQLKSWLNENLLNYKKKLNEHDITAMVGWTIQANTDERWGLTGEQVPIETLELSGLDNGIPGPIETYQSENRLMSYIGRVTYGFKSKYLFTGTFRADGSSKFAKGNQWAYFPSAALAWRIDQENFLKNSNTISNAKLRLSYGLTGNNRIGDFSRYSQLIMAYGYYYPFNNTTNIPGIKSSIMGNDNLKWETTAQYNIGLDLSFWNNRINLIGDWYYKKTKDLLLYAGVPYTTGYSRIYKNIGSVANRGLEFTLNTVNVQSGKFKWESDFNISFNQNKVLSLNDDQNRLLTPVSWTGEYGNTPLYIAQVGQPVSQFIGLIWEGVYTYGDFDKVGDTYVLKADRPSNGNPRAIIQPGDIRYRDINGDGIINAYDNVVIGRALPVHIGGFNNNFVYGGLSLNVFFQWSYGNDIMNANRIYLEGNMNNRSALNQFKTYADRWTPENPESNLFRAGGQGPIGYYSNRTLEDGSFLRLKTVNLSYELPSRFIKSIKAQTLSIYFSGQNLYTWTKYSGMDPEVSVRNSALTPGFDYSAYPRARTFVCGIKATF